MLSKSQLHQRSKQQLKRKRPIEQQQPVCAAQMTSARFVLDLEECVYFNSQTVPGK